MRLSKRLEAIAELVPQDSSVLDVGSDHALLDIYLVETGRVRQVIASDVHEGAYLQGKQNVRRAFLEDQIDLRLGDGLSVLTPQDSVDTVVIAGMGGNTMVEIFRAAPEELTRIPRLVLQPNNAIVAVRETLTQEFSYQIEEERLVKEHGIIYTILAFTKGDCRYSDSELLMGPQLLQQKDELFYEVNQKLIQSYQDLLKKIPESAVSRRQHIEQIVEQLQKQLYE